MPDHERRKLVITEQKLGIAAEPKILSALEGFAAFTLREDDDELSTSDSDYLDADSFFNLPNDEDDDQPNV